MNVSNRIASENSQVQTFDSFVMQFTASKNQDFGELVKNEAFRKSLNSTPKVLWSGIENDAFEV